LENVYILINNLPFSLRLLQDNCAGGPGSAMYGPAMQHCTSSRAALSLCNSSFRTYFLRSESTMRTSPQWQCHNCAHAIQHLRGINPTDVLFSRNAPCQQGRTCCCGILLSSTLSMCFDLFWPGNPLASLVHSLSHGNRQKRSTMEGFFRQTNEGRI